MHLALGRARVIAKAAGVVCLLVTAVTALLGRGTGGAHIHPANDGQNW